MTTGRNVPVLIGSVPLFTVTSLTLNEGYQVARIAGSRLAQLVSPTTKTISDRGGAGRLHPAARQEGPGGDGAHLARAGRRDRAADERGRADRSSPA